MRLAAGQATAILDPQAGAGVVSLDVGKRAILSTGTGRTAGSPFAQGMNLLLPFSNRISGPFPYEGRTHPVPANLPGEPFPIHGDGFQKAWTVAAQGPDHATLTLSGGIGPYVYDAEVRYTLTSTALSAELRMTNRADIALPYGGGFHPWVPRHPDTHLGFRATGYWPQDDRHLPRTTAPDPLPPALVFDPPTRLPDGWINTAFAGWDGQASLRQPGLRIDILATGCETLILYSPATDAPFLCIEPVSHPVDAHTLPGQPGLTRLAPGESLVLGLTLSWTPDPEGAPA